MTKFIERDEAVAILMRYVSNEHRDKAVCEIYELPAKEYNHTSNHFTIRVNSAEDFRGFRWSPNV